MSYVTLKPAFIKGNVPQALECWLITDASLTRKFEALANKPLKVKPLFEGFQYLNTKDSASLNLPRRSMAWVRKTALFGDDEEPWAYAKSVFPVPALSGKSRRLRYLGTTPLGYLLFKRENPTCNRNISITRTSKQTIYARNNFYTWNRQLILVSETFSPTFIARISDS